MKSKKKFIEKLKNQELKNPGKKEKRDVFARPRASVFRSKKDYNRQAETKKLRKEIDEY